MALLHHLATLAQVCWVKQRRERGRLGPFFPSALPSAFLPHSFVPPLCTALHSPRPAIHAPTGSFIPRPAAIPSAAPECTWLPAPQACPSVPSRVRPAWARAGAGQPRLRCGAGAGGEPDRERGGGRSLREAGRVGGAPAAPQLGRARPRRGRVRAGGGGGSGSGTRARRRRRLRRRRRAADAPGPCGRAAGGPGRLRRGR